MKRKNGFTLVEILAVVVILAILTLVAIPVVTHSIRLSKEKIYKEQVTRILEATEKLMQKNEELLPAENSWGESVLDDEGLDYNTIKDKLSAKRYSIEDLKNQGLIKNTDIKNPIKTSINMDPYVAIYYNPLYRQYDVVYCASEEYYKYYYDEEDYNKRVKIVCEVADATPIQDQTTTKVTPNPEPTTTTTTKPADPTITVDIDIDKTEKTYNEIKVFYTVDNANEVKVEYRLNNSTTWNNATGCSMTECLMIGLSQDKDYTIRVTAFNGDKQNYDETTTKTLLLGTPQFPAAVPVQDGWTQAGDWIRVNNKNWTNKNSKFTIKYDSTALDTVKHYFLINKRTSIVGSNPDKITADGIVYYCDYQNSTFSCREDEIAPNTPLVEGWYQLKSGNSISLKYDREYEYIFNAHSRYYSKYDGQQTNVRKNNSGTYNNIDKTGPRVDVITKSSNTNSLKIEYTISDKLTDRNTTGSGVKTETCKCGLSKSNLNLTATPKTTNAGKECAFSGLEDNKTYYCKIIATDNVGNQAVQYEQDTQVDYIEVTTGNFNIKPTITLVDYNTFKYSAEGGKAYFVSMTQTQKPDPGTTAAKSSFELDRWTTATNTGNLSLQEGIYHVWVKDSVTGGNVSSWDARIPVRKITKSQGDYTTLKVPVKVEGSPDYKEISGNPFLVLHGTPARIDVTKTDGYGGLSMSVTTNNGTAYPPNNYELKIVNNGTIATSVSSVKVTYYGCEGSSSKKEKMVTIGGEFNETVSCSKGGKTWNFQGWTTSPTKGNNFSYANPYKSINTPTTLYAYFTRTETTSGTEDPKCTSTLLYSNPEYTYYRIYRIKCEKTIKFVQDHYDTSGGNNGGGSGAGTSGSKPYHGYEAGNASNNGYGVYYFTYGAQMCNVASSELPETCRQTIQAGTTFYALSAEKLDGQGMGFRDRWNITGMPTTGTKSYYCLNGKEGNL